jgi:hypothetical protein
MIDLAQRSEPYEIELPYGLIAYSLRPRRWGTLSRNPALPPEMTFSYRVCSG